MQAKIKKLVLEIEFDNESSPYNGKLYSPTYLKRFISFRQSIIANLKDYIPVDVVPKEPPRYYSLLQVQGNNNIYHDLKHNKLVHFPRQGSFEVTIDNFLVFSRLQTGSWPDIEILTEWAFKVAEKMLDVEIEKERPTIQNSKQQSYSRREETNTNRKISQNSRERRRSANGSFAQQKLPRIGPSADQRNSIVSNFTTLPVRPVSKNSTLTPEKGKSRQDVLRGFNKKDFQKTQRVFRYSNKQQPTMKQRVSAQRPHVYYTVSKSRPKHQSFHWNLGTPLNLSVDKANTPNGDLLRETIHRTKKIQLQPLRKQMALQADKNLVDSLKINKYLQERIEKRELRVSDSNLNTFRGNYQIQNNLIIKHTHHKPWTPILCENVLPLKGQYYFTLAVINSAQNMIKIGIVPLNYCPDAHQEQERKDEFFIAYDCSNGMIRDSKLEENSEATRWRLGGDSSPRKKPYQIRVTVDMDANYIDWYIEEDIVASSKISLQFNKGFRVILNIADANDCVLLNDQNWKDKVKGEDGRFYYRASPTKIEQASSKEREFTMDEGMQTSFVGTIKKQRVTKFMQRKRNASVVRDQSSLEQQILHQQNEIKEEKRFNIESKIEQKQSSIEPKQHIVEIQPKQEEKQLSNQQLSNGVKPHPQPTQTKTKQTNIQINKQATTITPVTLQTRQKDANNTQLQPQPNKTLIPDQQHKEHQPTEKKQQKNTTIVGQPQSKAEIPNKTQSNILTENNTDGTKIPVGEKSSESKPEAPDDTAKKFSQAKPEAPNKTVANNSVKSDPQVANTKAEMIEQGITAEEEQIEWIASFQENSFKINPKGVRG